MNDHWDSLFDVNPHWHSLYPCVRAWSQRSALLLGHASRKNLAWFGAFVCEYNWSMPNEILRFAQNDRGWQLR
ncbi:MAG: hypothetical protein JXR70_05475, partial [Spirochaetales bacterium]|nr:hypothetical protein [Spirochaetales bacterium]